MTISDSRDVNCRANAPGLGSLSHSLGAPLSAFSSCSKADSDFGDTLVRIPSERDAAEQKPTAVRKGYWRNKWSSEAGWYNLKRGTTVLDKSVVIAPAKFTCPQVAETKALKLLAQKRASGEWITVKYLGPVFFPEEGGAS